MSDLRDNKIDTLIENAMGSIKSLVNMETVIGNAVDMGNDCKAYPVIKITVGLVAGGGEYSNKLILKRQINYPFAGGTGTGFTAEPIAFLISRPTGCELITLQNTNAMSDVAIKLVNATTDYLKNLAKSKSKEKNNE